MTSRGGLLWNWLIFLLGIATLCSTTYAVWKNFSPVPYGDSWDGTIAFYMRALLSPWRAFFEQHNEHRLTFSRLIFFADVRYFGGRNVLSLISNLVLAGSLATAFVRIARRFAPPPLSKSSSLGLVGAALVFTFSWIQEENFTWGFQSQWFAVYLFALLCFDSLELSAEARDRKATGVAYAWLILSLGCGWLATYSMSSGVLVLPILIVQAVYLRLRSRDALIIVATTVAVWVAYFLDWQAPASSGNLRANLLQHPVSSVHYALLYLGAPAKFAHLGSIGADLCGLIVILSLAAGCVHAAQNREAKPHGVALLTLALFVTGNAFLTAGGRLWFGLDTAMSSRYTTASLSAWLALILFAGINAPTGKRRKQVIVITALATILIGSAQRFVFKFDEATIYARRIGGLALRSHVYDPDITRAVYPFPDQLKPIVQQAEAQRLSIFADDQKDYLVPPPAIAATSVCSSHIDEIRPTSTSGVYEAVGWIYNPARHNVPQNVVITDTAGKTLGVGVVGGEREDVRPRFGRSAKYSGWTAFFAAPSAGDVRVAGQIKGNTYCSTPATLPMPVFSNRPD